MTCFCALNHKDNDAEKEQCYSMTIGSSIAFSFYRRLTTINCYGNCMNLIKNIEKSGRNSV